MEFSVVFFLMLLSFFVGLNVGRMIEKDKANEEQENQRIEADYKYRGRPRVPKDR